MTRNRLYSIILAACMAGLIWVVWNHSNLRSDAIQPFCIFHKVTGLPCPACGTTRATVMLIHGQIWEAISTNPLSLATTAIMLLAPLWIALDLVTRKSSLLVAYRWMEQKLKQKRVAIPLILMVVAIWIRNILLGI
ncbi:MAG: DUF2752 domain-containing protein [Breznakibacter sp.]|nr:DUF2752 domain-containing protein [Breznakibacter sp.]